MKVSLAVAVLVALVVSRSDAQVVRESTGEVSRGAARVDSSRLATRIPGMDAAQRVRVRVGGDSAQRIALSDFDWRGRVISVEFDEEDARLFWDVKIVPDSSQRTVVRYRVDAWEGGILSIKEFAGVPGVARRRP